MESFDLFVTKLVAAGFSEEDIAAEALHLPDVAAWVDGNRERAMLVEATVRATYPGFRSMLAPAPAASAPARSVPITEAKRPTAPVLAR